MHRVNRETAAYRLLAGLLFGGVGVVGMMTPMHFSPGIIYDGRSIILSVAGLFGGPQVAAVAAGLCAAYRAWLGGAGVWAGLAVIIEAASLGVGLHLLRRRDPRWVRPGALWAFGLLVHALMMALQVLLLPGGSGWEVLRRVGPAVLVLYPIGTVLICRLFLDREARLVAETARHKSEERYATTLLSIGDGVIVTDLAGRVELLNPVAERLTGWTSAEAIGKPLEEIFRGVHEETRAPVENPIRRVMREGGTVGLANDTALIARDGTERPIADSAAPIRDASGALAGVVLVFRDQTAVREAEKESRLLTDTLRASLNEIYLFDANTLAFRFVNDGALRNLGYSLEEIRRLTPLDIKPDVTADRFAKLVEPLRTGAALLVTFEAVHQRRDGSRYPVEVHLQFFDRAGDQVFLAVIQDITERQRAEAALRESETVFRNLFERHAAVKLLIDPDSGTIVDANDAAARFYGWSRDQLKRMRIQDINTLAPDAVRTEMEKARDEARIHFEFRHRRADGSIRDVEVFSSPVAVKGAGLLHSIVHDTTEHKRAEAERAMLQAQLLQSQKIEAVGRLAGGVAHDFNNMLGVILGHIELALMKTDAAHPLHTDLVEIRKAAERSADLVRQLLAFARKQTIAPKVLDLNDTVEHMLKMLRRLIGEDIDLAWLPRGGLWPVKMDPAQLDQLLANLCVNARDAIEGVGKVTIETDNMTFDAPYCAEHPGSTPGDFVRLAVSDDGCGMDKDTLSHLFEPFFTTKGIGQGMGPDTKARIFEPFFTTKEKGKGTGLGLATVYGIVKQNSGFISVYSEPGTGTTFKIYLPRHAGSPGEIQAESRTEIPKGRGEIVLVVEDEPAILKTTTMMLTSLGYTPLIAPTPGEALRLAAQHAGRIHLLMTDVVMPEMNGRELAERLRALTPTLPCLFMSGYTANVIAHHGVLEAGVHFLQKPYPLGELARKVHEALNG